EPGGMGRVRGPPQEPGGDHGLERLRDLRELIPDVLGQTLGDEESPRMPREEQQKIEIARVPQTLDSVKEIPDSLCRHEKTSSMLALPRGARGQSDYEEGDRRRHERGGERGEPIARRRWSPSRSTTREVACRYSTSCRKATSVS